MGRQQKGQPLRVLVVEDDAGTARTWARLLGSLGHEAEVAADGPAAVRAAEARPPDVVLLDIGLPGMSGYEAARRLRQLPTDGRAVLRTADTVLGPRSSVPPFRPVPFRLQGGKETPSVRCRVGRARTGAAGRGLRKVSIAWASAVAAGLTAAPVRPGTGSVPISTQ